MAVDTVRQHGMGLFGFDRDEYDSKMRVAGELSHLPSRCLIGLIEWPVKV